jgi:PKD repeat protein
MGVIYNDNNAKDNYLKLILDEPPVTCNVRADFALNNDPEKTTAIIGEEITFTNNSTGDGVDSATWEWSFEASPDNRTFPEDIKNEKEPSITFNKEGNYTVKLVASGKEGEADCTSYRTIDFEVKCGVEANFTASAISISKGKTIKFTNTSTGISVTDGSAVWEWSFKYPLNTIFPETLKNEKSPELTFENIGQYIINLKASMPGDLCSTNKNIAYAPGNIVYLRLDQVDFTQGVALFGVCE